MKKIIALITMVAFTGNLAAQNVGIGTTEPINKLQVQGSLLITAPTTATSTAPTAGQIKTMVNAGTITFANTDSTGRIYDPGGAAGNYAANQTANTSITSAANATGVELTIESIDLSSGDSLIIKESISGATLLAVGNLYTTTGKWVFNSSSLYIIFKSNGDANVGAGFSLLFRRLYNTAATLPDVSGFTGNALLFDTKRGILRSGAIKNAVQGDYSTALGFNTVANKYAAVALGNSTNATGDYSTALGNFTTASGNSAFATGFLSNASGDYSIAMSYNAQATGDHAIAMGRNTIASGDYSFVSGWENEASGDYSTAIGYHSNAGGNFSFSVGHTVGTSSGMSYARGYFTSANGYISTAIGEGTFANGNYSTAIGYGTQASGFASTALGRNTTASGDTSFAAGYGTMASGQVSTAIGFSTTASGFASTAMGSQNTASGNASIAMGNNTTASGLFSTAMGSITTASGDRSTAMGFVTTASGDKSTAMGSYVSTNNFDGALIIGDNSTTTVLNIATANSFRARFDGGYRFFTSAAAINAESCQLPAGGNAWVTASDFRLKEKVTIADGEDFLKKIATMKLGSWNYHSQNPLKQRHYGPMAQDFYAAFGKDEFGTIGNDTTINSADFDGVNLIAIQALEKRTQKIEQLEKENEELKKLMLQLRKEMDELKGIKNTYQ